MSETQNRSKYTQLVANLRTELQRSPPTDLNDIISLDDSHIAALEDGGFDTVKKLRTASDGDLVFVLQTYHSEELFVKYDGPSYDLDECL